MSNSLPLGELVNSRVHAWTAQRCVMSYINECSGDGNAVTFTDELSEREYHISAMCQACQNAFYSEDEE